MAMKTLRLTADPADPESEPSREAIAQAAGILLRGGLVAFPTETVYGLGANALDPAAVAAIFAAKERPSWDPVIVHIGDSAQLGRIATGISGDAESLVRAFWPGPLTLLLPKHPAVPGIVTAQRELVGVRMPAHPVALALLRAAQVPVAAPSANRFGRTSATTAAHVAEDLDGRIDAILDGGATTHGLESTVLQVRPDGCTIFRPGIITLEQIRGVVAGPVTQLPEPTAGSAPEHTGDTQVSPGLGLRHYAPRARLLLVEESAGQPERVTLLARTAEDEGERVGLMLPRGFPRPELKAPVTYDWGDWSDHEELARRLFAGLRSLDAQGATVIVCPIPPAQGIGSAIRDRLRKAARR